MVLTRSAYLKEPEKWFGTTEEAELIVYCTHYTLHSKNFHFNFSPTQINITNGNISYNSEAISKDIYFLILSKKVLEVYYGSHRRSN